METYVRGRTSEALGDGSRKVDRALHGAVIALGCRVKIEIVLGNLPLRSNAQVAALFRDNAKYIFGENSDCDYPHSGGLTDAGDLSQIMPVLHPMMTGTMGKVHSSDWHIADVDSGYLAPARTLTMMAVDLLCNTAAIGCGVLSQHEPALTNEKYLRQQSDLFSTVTYDGASCIWERGKKPASQASMLPWMTKCRSFVPLVPYQRGTVTNVINPDLNLPPD